MCEPTLPAGFRRSSRAFPAALACREAFTNIARMRALLLVLALGFSACAAVVAQPAGPRGVPSVREARAVCEAVAADRVEVVVTGSDWSRVDVNNDGVAEDARIVSHFSSATAALEHRVGDEVVYHDDADWRDEFQTNIGSHLRLIRHRGRTYVVNHAWEGVSGHPYPQMVAIYLPDGTARVLCDLESATEIPPLSPISRDDAATCREIERRRLHPQDDFPFASAPALAMQGPFDTQDEEQEADIDFMNDRAPRRLLHMHYYSAAGSSCGAGFFVLAGQTDPEASRILEELQTAGPTRSEESGGQPITTPDGRLVCRGNAPRFHRINGQVVFEQRFPEDRPVDQRQEFWWAARVEDGQVVRICEARGFRSASRVARYNADLYPESP